MNFSCHQYFLVQIYYLIESRQNLLFFITNCRNINSSRRWYVLNAWFFHINMLLLHRNLAKFGTNWQNMNFPHSWYFLNVWGLFFLYFFCINTLLFCWKSANLATNYQNMKFSHGWYFYFLNMQLFCKYFISQKSTKFMIFYY